MYQPLRLTLHARLTPRRSDVFIKAPLLACVQAALLLLALAAVLLTVLQVGDVDAVGGSSALFAVALLCVALRLNTLGQYRVSLTLTLGLAFAMPWAATLCAYAANSGELMLIPLMVLPVQLGLLFLPVRPVLLLSLAQVLAVLCLLSQTPSGSWRGGWWAVAFLLIVSLLCAAATHLIRSRVAMLDARQAAVSAARSRHGNAEEEPSSLPISAGQLDAALHSLTNAPDQPFGLLMIDLDYFRFINEAFGCLQGDDVRLRVADALAGAIGERDVLILCEGGSFAVLLSTANGSDTLSQAEALRQRVAEVWQPDSGGGRIILTASIGAAHYPENGNDPAAMLRAANFALTQARQEGCNRVAAAFPVG